MSDFILEETAPLTLQATAPLSQMYTLSPFVWQDDEGYGLMLRAVPHSDRPAEKIARVYYGRSQDGLAFVMDDQPAIAPGPGPEDLDGCEDPTLAVVDGVSYVYYTGWNETKKEGLLMLASGPDCRHLEKQGVRLAATNDQMNPKEATIVAVADGTYRLFYEYSDGKASLIGIASAPNVDGPWSVGTPLFAPRENSWDNWHLSTGPILDADPMRPVMFYNGATQDAKWRIGWVAFDAEYTRVVARSVEPLITPPPQEGDATDIAFASSAIEVGDKIYLYYSIADKDMTRAVARRA